MTCGGVADAVTADARTLIARCAWPTRHKPDLDSSSQFLLVPLFSCACCACWLPPDWCAQLFVALRHTSSPLVNTNPSLSPLPPLLSVTRIAANQTLPAERQLGQRPLPRVRGHRAGHFIRTHVIPLRTQQPRRPARAGTRALRPPRVSALKPPCGPCIPTLQLRFVRPRVSSRLPSCPPGGPPATCSASGTRGVMPLPGACGLSSVSSTRGPIRRCASREHGAGDPCGGMPSAAQQRV